MPRYRTLDQHVLCDDRLIEPGTEVEVSEDDAPTWDQLVRLKAAERLISPDEEIDESEEVWEDAPPEDEGVEKDDAPLVPPGA